MSNLRENLLKKFPIIRFTFSSNNSTHMSVPKSNIIAESISIVKTDIYDTATNRSSAYLLSKQALIVNINK